MRTKRCTDMVIASRGNGFWRRYIRGGDAQKGRFVLGVERVREGEPGTECLVVGRVDA